MATLIAFALSGAFAAPVTAGPFEDGVAAKKYKGFRKLTGPEIQRVFVDLDLLRFPNNEGTKNNAPWSLGFDAKGNWVGTYTEQAATANGTSHVENGKLCIVVKGLYMEFWEPPYEGCFAVYADAENGVLAAKISLRSGIELAVMTTTAYSEIARAIAPAPTFKGQGVTQDYAEAVKRYRKAAQQGNALAQFNLGGMYYNGQGVTQDYVTAHMWWNIAASKGNAISAINRDLVAKRMTPAQIAEAQKLAREWRPK